MTEHQLSPAAWFDQFTGLAHDPVMDRHPQWCWRHWAPCPVLGADGLRASLLLATMLVAGSTSAVEANAMIDPEQGRLCCRLGDEEMYAVWTQCPPPGSEN